jgi:hypothetical protein
MISMDYCDHRCSRAAAQELILILIRAAAFFFSKVSK